MPQASTSDGARVRIQRVAGRTAAALLAVIVTASPPARAQSTEGFMRGPVPACVVVSDLQADPPVAARSEPVALAVDVSVTCPDLLHDRSVVLVLGGIPSPSLVADVRGTLRRVVEAFPSGRGNRIAFLDAADAGDDAAWVDDADGLARLAARMERIDARAPISAARWSSVLEVASERVAKVGPRSRPFLVVIDGGGGGDPQEPDAERAMIEGIDALGQRTIDAAGHVLLVDLRSNVPAFLRLVALGRPYIVVFQRAETANRIAATVADALAAFDVPLEHVTPIVVLPAVILENTCAPIDTVPSAWWRNRVQAEWPSPATGRVFHLSAILRLRVDDPIPPATIGLFTFVQRRGLPMRSDAGPTVAVCVRSAPGDPCPPAPVFPPNPEATPIPRACPPRAVAWLPLVWRTAVAGPAHEADP